MSNVTKYVGRLSGLLNNPKRELNKKQDTMRAITAEEIRKTSPFAKKRLYSIIVPFNTISEAIYDDDGIDIIQPETSCIEKGKYFIVLGDPYEMDTTLNMSLVEKLESGIININDLNILKEYDIPDDIIMITNLIDKEGYKLSPIKLYRDECTDYMDKPIFLLCLDVNDKFKYVYKGFNGIIMANNSECNENDIGMVEVSTKYVGIGELDEFGNPETMIIYHIDDYFDLEIS